MNKAAIKNYAIWARNKLIADITYKAGLLGITDKEMRNPLPQSTQTVQFFDIGTKEPSSITGSEIEQRKKLVEEIQKKANLSDYSNAYKNIIEEVAYTWFNRLIAIRFMEVNDYLPSGVRVLSSDSSTKSEPDLVTNPYDAEMYYTEEERQLIQELKHNNKLDQLFRMLFIKQCNELNKNLPELFEKTNDYTELLLNISFTDKEGVVYHLVKDIPEDDFNVEKEGQIEIIGWLYQYYNTEPKDETFALLKKNVKITKERIPSATQLFTPDWIVRYMVENSLGRLWLEGHPNDNLKSNWKYYLDDAAQEENFENQLERMREEYKGIKPENIKVIDPAMGSGHILVYAFDIFMQIYESYGYSQGDAAKSIIENNLYGLDIDNRAYQLAYFAVMMKARQYNRTILNEDTMCHLYAIQESNSINRNQLKYFGSGLNDMEKNTALLQINGFLDTFIDAKEYGSILSTENYNWRLLSDFVRVLGTDGQMSLESIGVESTRNQLDLLIKIGEVMIQKYDVVVTNPPYMGSSGMSTKLSEYLKKNYPNSKSDLFAVFIEKSIQITKDYRYLGMITQQSWMYLNSFTNLRELILSYSEIINILHLGAGAFEEISGEVVQSCSFVLHTNTNTLRRPNILNLKYYSTSSAKELALLECSSKRYELLSQKDYLEIPDYILAYKLTYDGLETYKKNKLIKDIFAVKRGPSLPNNEMYLRKWYEVSYNSIATETESSSQNKWLFCSRSGSKAKWFEIIDEVVKHEVLSKISNSDFQKTRGIVWPDARYGSQSICARIKEEHIAFESGVNLIEVSSDDDLYLLLAYFNTYLYEDMLSSIVNGQHFSPIYIKKIPYIKIYDKLIASMVSEIISLLELIANNMEISPSFSNFFNLNKINVQESFNYADELINSSLKTISNYETVITEKIEVATGIDKENQKKHALRLFISNFEHNEYVKSFISYFIGCLFGRYSLDIEGLAFAGGEWDDSKYSSFIPDKDNVLPITDEEYFKDDIVELFTAFVKKTYGEETLEENLSFIADALGNKGDSPREIIRNYFIKDFFKDHVKTYKKRPIYWMFDSGKQDGFKALIYMHRYDENTIGNLRVDYLHKIQKIYESEIQHMENIIQESSDVREVTKATKRQEKLKKQLQETREYDEKITHLALARISIDLDDGVKVNYEKVQTDTNGKKLEVLAKI
ncbi:MAG: BREX-1 system adenine-specific DNA-methyltransferase PglX [Gudongella sp.]|nr:BREX-1 system adenine-specific DNA-methyltransferase PglX [Gudongella sp.]